MAWEAIASQAIDSGILVGQNIASQSVSKKQAETTFGRNKELMDYQYNKDLDMWNRQNQYNSPQSQMDRFTDAGLNPNLIYSQGNPGNAVNIPKYQAPEYRINRPALDFGRPGSSMLQQYNNTRVANAQISATEAQRDYTKQRTINEGLNEAYKVMSNDLFRRNLPWKQQQEYNKAMIGIEGIDIARSKAGIEHQRQLYAGQLFKSQASMSAENARILQSLNNARLRLIEQQIKSAQRDYNWKPVMNIGKIGTQAAGAVGLSKIGNAFNSGKSSYGSTVVKRYSKPDYYNIGRKGWE